MLLAPQIKFHSPPLYQGASQRQKQFVMRNETRGKWENVSAIEGSEVLSMLFSCSALSTPLTTVDLQWRTRHTEPVCWKSFWPLAGSSSGLLLESTENNYVQTQNTDDARFKVFLNTDRHPAQTSDETSEMLGICYTPGWPVTLLHSEQQSLWRLSDGNTRRGPSAEEHWLWSDSSGAAPVRKQKKKNHR